MIEPKARNHSAMGYDVGSEPVRRAALMEAIRTGRPTLTGRITLLQDAQKRAGLLYMLPLYGGPITPPTEALRHTSLVGVYYSPIVIDEILHGLTESGDRQINVTLTDQAQGKEPAALLFNEHEPKGPEIRPAAPGVPDGPFTAGRKPPMDLAFEQQPGLCHRD